MGLKPLFSLGSGFSLQANLPPKAGQIGLSAAIRRPLYSSANQRRSGCVFGWWLRLRQRQKSSNLPPLKADH
ncbi:MAG: hypothetical protein EAY75_10370 [Bacteroidetes bacterium]|nr:MAG: hypothetical protein EAY75_10370 [Bacteroidota bacterium]